jgi:hypothetical protein
MVGCDVLEGRWTFQIIEEFDAVYYEAFRPMEGQIRFEFLDGRAHVYESEMKRHEQRTGGMSGKVSDGDRCRHDRPTTRSGMEDPR